MSTTEKAKPTEEILATTTVGGQQVDLVELPDGFCVRTRNATFGRKSASSIGVVYMDKDRSVREYRHVVDCFMEDAGLNV